MGPGQQLGRCLARLPNRLEAYTIDILGSIAGIVVFAACSFLELPPTWWFAIVMAGFSWFLVAGRSPPRRGARCWDRRWCWRWRSTPAGARGDGPQQMWSPYYRIDYRPADRLINVNLIGHQQMQPRDAAFPAYALPHLLNRDAGGQPFGQVLIIGAGSGNDVSRALAWGARARRRGRDRSGDPADRQARSSRSPLRRSARLRAPQRRPQLPEVRATSSTT